MTKQRQPFFSIAGGAEAFCRQDRESWATVFPLSRLTGDKDIAKVTEKLELAAAGFEIVPLDRRHTSPSRERYVDARPTEVARRRGKMGALSSCACFEKHTRLLRVPNMVTDDIRMTAATSVSLRRRA